MSGDTELFRVNKANLQSLGLTITKAPNRLFGSKVVRDKTILIHLRSYTPETSITLWDHTDPNSLTKEEINGLDRKVLFEGPIQDMEELNNTLNSLQEWKK